jgi:hypothetical protein
MRRLLCSFVVIVIGSLPINAGDLPGALALRLQQGVQACVAYYKDNAALTSLQQFGFSPKGTGAEITLAPPVVPNKIKVRVYTEGPQDIECEIHANYTRNDTQKHAFNLTLAVLQKKWLFSTVRTPLFKQGKNDLPRRYHKYVPFDPCQTGQGDD